MKATLALLGSLAASVAAFPRMAEMRDEVSEIMERNAAADPDSPLAPLTNALTEDIKGLLGSVAKGTLDTNNIRPEPGYKFRAPGPNDSRGPCPGLNLLANYGYLPRNGYVNAENILEATARGFNMGQDLATVLIVFAVLSDGDLDTDSWWLGSDPKTNIGGLNRHSTVEADISPNREDFYNGCGDDHHLSSRMFRRNVRIVAQSKSKQFDIANMATHYAIQADFAKKYNPTFYYFPFPMIVSVVAYNFYDRFFSNGTSEFGGVANYESISAIVGAKHRPGTDQFEYVPERWPENWYRRAFPYTAEQALLEGFTLVYPKNPVLPGGSIQLPPQNVFNSTNLICDVYQGLNSLVPLTLAGDEEKAAAKISWAVGMFDKAFKNTVAGCHRGTISQNSGLYPHAHKKGGPLNPPKHVIANSGNNVYNKVYFPTAPKTPQCNHVMD